MSRLFSRITVEPGLILLVVGLSIPHTLFGVALVNKICHQIGLEKLPGQNVDCSNLKLYAPAFSKEIEITSANLMVWVTTFTTLTTMLSTFMLSALSDRVGRKMNILIGTAGWTLQSLLQLVVIATPNSPLWIIVAGSALVGCTGGVTLAFTSCSQYVADVLAASGEKSMTVRLSIVHYCYSIGDAFGSIISAQLVEVMNVPWCMATGICIASPSMLWFLWRIDNVRPVKKLLEESGYELLADADLGTDDEESAAKTPAKISVLRNDGNASFKTQLFDLAREIWRSHSRERPQNYRTFLLGSVAVYSFACFCFHGYETLNATYMTTPPLSLTTSTFPYFVCLGGLSITAGSALAGALFKKLKTPDLIIMGFCMISLSLSPLVIGIARQNWVLFLAPVLGCLRMLFVGSYQAHLVHLTDPDEIGKVFAGQTICSRLAYLVSGAAFGKIYAATAKTYRSAAFLISAALDLIAAAIIFGLHFVVVLQQSEAKDEISVHTVSSEEESD